MRGTDERRSCVCNSVCSDTALSRHVLNSDAPQNVRACAGGTCTIMGACLCPHNRPQGKEQAILRRFTAPTPQTEKKQSILWPLTAPMQGTGQLPMNITRKCSALAPADDWLLHARKVFE